MHPEYLDSIGRLLGFATRAVSQLSAELLAEHGLTLPQWVVLTALWRQDGLSVTAIANYTRSTVPAASRLLGRMEDQSLIRRRATKGDRRGVRVWLTKEASAMSDLLSIYEDINDMVLEGFSPAEKKRLSSYLERIAANAEGHATNTE